MNERTILFLSAAFIINLAAYLFGYYIGGVFQ